MDEWTAEFEANRVRPLEQRFRYSFVRTYKPVLDDEPFRAFDASKVAANRVKDRESLPRLMAFRDYWKERTRAHARRKTKPRARPRRHQPIRPPRIRPSIFSAPGRPSGWSSRPSLAASCR